MNKILRFFITFFIFIYPLNLIASTTKSIGEKGDPKNVDRVIKIKMYDNYYEPSLITVKKGETIKFIVYNYGELVHEFNIATKEMHIKHQPEMMKMVEHEILLADRIDKEKMKEMAKKDHSMAHSHSNSVLLEPNKIGEIIWKFNNDANLEAACNVPGHYEAGMIANININ